MIRHNNIKNSYNRLQLGNKGWLLLLLNEFPYVLIYQNMSSIKLIHACGFGGNWSTAVGEIETCGEM